MSLQELNKEIHTIRDKSEMQSKLSTIKSEIKNILSSGGEDKETYFQSHTGRELFRKLYNLDLVSEIKDDFDSGFRPTPFNLNIGRHKNSVTPLNFWCNISDVDLHPSSSKIIKIKDQSGNNNHLSFESDSNDSANISSHNGHPTAIIEEGDYFESNISNTGVANDSARYLFYIVAKVTGVNHGSDSIFSIGQGGSGTHFQFDAKTSGKFLHRFVGNNLTGAGSGSSNITFGSANHFGDFHIFGAFLDPTLEQLSLSVDGEYSTTIPYSHNISNTFNLRIFANRNSSQFPAGEFCECVIHGDESKKDEIESYLSKKWAIPLHSSHNLSNQSFKTLLE
tara:strand:+ start:1416 stop:2426 length:1011 start_codon:yes stop_codon:yes gene_type:complete